MVTATISSAFHRSWSASRTPRRSRHPKSSRPCMSIYRPTRSRTSGVGFSLARLQTACWSPSRWKTMSWSIHPYLGETDAQSRLEWISTLDKLEALKPKVVIAGHKVPENDDDPRNIAETRQYLHDFNRLNTATSTARELYDAMLKIYPDRVNPGSLWSAANILKKNT